MGHNVVTIDTTTGASRVYVVNDIQGKTCITVTGSISANTQVVAAVANKRIKVFAIEWETAYSTGTITPILTDGNGGTTLDSSLLQAPASGVMGKVKAVSPSGYLCATTAGNALYMNPNGQTVNYSISYFADDAT